MGRLPSNFWADVADAVNGASEDDDSALQVILSEEDPHRDEIMSMDLEEFDIMTYDIHCHPEEIQHAS